jgi:hypothetical protein
MDSEHESTLADFLEELRQHGLSREPPGIDRRICGAPEERHSFGTCDTDTDFKVDWNHQEQGKAYVVKVSLFGFELILNQVEPETEGRGAGHGRVFIGLNDDQAVRFRQHLKEKDIKPTFTQWGGPTFVIQDMDGNEMFFWLPDKERANLEAELAGA